MCCPETEQTFIQNLHVIEIQLTTETFVSFSLSCTSYKGTLNIFKALVQFLVATLIFLTSLIYHFINLAIKDCIFQQDCHIIFDSLVDSRRVTVLVELGIHGSIRIAKLCDWILGTVATVANYPFSLCYTFNMEVGIEVNNLLVNASVTKDTQ